MKTLSLNFWGQTKAWWVASIMSKMLSDSYTAPNASADDTYLEFG